MEPEHVKPGAVVKQRHEVVRADQRDGNTTPCANGCALESF